MKKILLSLALSFLTVVANAATATGQIAINYAVLPDSNPYTNAQFAYPTGSGNGQVLSGVFRYGSGNSAVALRYTGAMSGAEIRSKIEVGATGTGGDEIGAAIVNSSGDGYAVKLTSATTATIVRLAAMVSVETLDAATVTSATGEVWELRRSPAGDFTVYQNGAQVVDLTVTDTTVTTGLSPGPLVIADNVGVANIISWAGDGIVTSSTVVNPISGRGGTRAQPVISN